MDPKSCRKTDVEVKTLPINDEENVDLCGFIVSKPVACRAALVGVIIVGLIIALSILFTSAVTHTSNGTTNTNNVITVSYPNGLTLSGRMTLTYSNVLMTLGQNLIITGNATLILINSTLSLDMEAGP